MLWTERIRLGHNLIIRMSHDNSYVGIMKSNYKDTRFVCTVPNNSENIAILYTLGENNHDLMKIILGDNRLFSSNELIPQYNRRNKEIIVLKSKEAIYNDAVSGYVLDFKGQIARASVKNFQIIDDNDSIVLQFGRVGENMFNIDVLEDNPLTILQAFIISLSVFPHRNYNFI